jgi:oxygen-independent coproporphyrinogen III oxidase
MSLGGVYLHVPFCKKKCSYCDFVSYEKKPNENYLNLVFQEYQVYLSENKDLIFDTLFIGGGTPSLLDPSSFRPLLELFLSELSYPNMPEISIEANPESLSLLKLQEYANMGINRISIGVQSFDTEVLKSTGRIHDQKQAILAVENAYKAGFRNISIDLISGLPGENLQTWCINQKMVNQLPLTHLSCYLLDLSAKSPMLVSIEKGTVKLPDELSSLSFYEEWMQYLHNSQWKHYEISNFCRPGFECKHNMHYWKGDPYLGLGVAAIGYIPPWRTKNTIQLGRYQKLISSGKKATIWKERITKKKKVKEKIMLGLRLLSEGICLTDIEVSNQDKIMFWVDKGFLEIKDTRLLLSPKGALYSNQIIVSLI